MLCLAIMQLAVRTGPDPSSQELSKLEPPGENNVPQGKTASPKDEWLAPPELMVGPEALEEMRHHPAFEGFPINPVTDAKLAASFCSKRCAAVPNVSFWDVPAPILFESGASCTGSKCYLDPPTDLAEEQRQSFIKRLGLNSHTKIAVVGSSGSLRYFQKRNGRSSGTEIDSHDVVVRINGAPCGGKYENHVGSKLTVDYSAPASLNVFKHYVHADPNGSKACGVVQKQVVAVMYQNMAICATSKVRAAAAAWALSKIPTGTTSAESASVGDGVWTVNPDWSCALWRDELGRAASYFPSTGMNAVGFFATLAKSLGAPPPSVYGFGGNTHGCEKYYDCYSKGIDYDANKWHPFNTEHRALNKWSEAGHIVRVV